MGEGAGNIEPPAASRMDRLGVFVPHVHRFAGGITETLYRYIGLFHGQEELPARPGPARPPRSTLNTRLLHTRFVCKNCHPHPHGGGIYKEGLGRNLAATPADLEYDPVKMARALEEQGRREREAWGVDERAPAYSPAFPVAKS